jgi:uncharacterized C2H2 Zn-finger protein
MAERFEDSWVLPPDVTGIEDMAAVVSLIWPKIGLAPVDTSEAAVGRKRLAAVLQEQAHAIVHHWDTSEDRWVVSGLTPAALCSVRVSLALQDGVTLHECARCKAIYRARKRQSAYCSITCASRQSAAAHALRKKGGGQWLP